MLFAFLQDESEGAMIDIMSEIEKPYISVGLTMPQNTYFLRSGLVDIYTKDNTIFKCNLTENNFKISLSPYMHVDVIWPIDNVNVYEIGWSFAEGKMTEPRLNYEDAWGLNIAAKGEIKDAFKEEIEAKVQNTKIGNPGYNPLNDDKILASVNELVEEFNKETETDESNSMEILIPEFSMMNNVFLEMGFSVKDDMNFGTVEAGALIRQGKSISLRINLNGSLAEITKSPYTTTIKDLIITSDGINLKYDGNDILIIRKASLEYGGKFKLLEYDLMAENIEQIQFARAGESLIRLFAVILNARKAGPYAGLALQSAPSSAVDPVIIDGITKSFIENEIGKLLIESIKEYRNAITEEIDLYKSIGME